MYSLTLYCCLHPNISMHILHTGPYRFPKVLKGRICLTIKKFLICDSGIKLKEKLGLSHCYEYMS